MRTSASLLTPPPLVTGPVDLRRLDDDIHRPLESFPTLRWWIAFSICGALATCFLLCAAYTIAVGIGSWGNNSPVGWGWGIINFVFWIGI
ncbi:MAG: hydrogenase, partial [Planctomycetes bacterium]|nr:hydrogenase [Planctomycetota bacterium]